MVTTELATWEREYFTGRGWSMTERRLARRADHLLGSIIDSSTSLLASQAHDVVRFAMGAPDEDLLPLADLDEDFAHSSA